MVGHHPLGIGLEVTLHVRGRPREKGVVLMKHHFRRGLLFDLESQAMRTEGWIKLKKVLVLELLWHQKTIGDWHASVCHERSDCVLTNSTFHKKPSPYS